MSWQSFLFNGAEGTVLGRSGLSWLKIFTFYVFFFAALLGFWVLGLFFFLHSRIDYAVPVWTGKGTIIGVNPGVGYQPWLSERPDSTLIRFNVSDPASYESYVAKMAAVLGKYAETNGTLTCDAVNASATNSHPCPFEVGIFAEGGCSSANDYGFKEGSPCVLLSLNRLIGWTPTPFPPDSVPPHIADRYVPGDVTLHCQGDQAADDENMGPVEYIPKSGLNGSFFPYRYTDPNYHAPLAMVKFTAPRRGIVMEVECGAYAYNLRHDQEKRLGMVHFELLVDGDEA